MPSPMKWLPIFLLLTVPAYADGAGGPLELSNNPNDLSKYVVQEPGQVCGMCHDALASHDIAKVEQLLAISPLFHDTPIADVFVGYKVHPPTQTPLPGTIWLLGLPLLWLGYFSRRQSSH